MAKLLPAGAILVLLAPAVAAADIVIGVAAPMSGQFAPFGEQLAAGAAQAVADINASGGLRGETLVLEIADDGCSESRAVAVANQLVGKGAVLVVGHVCSGPSHAASAVYAANGIVQVSPAATAPKFTDERAGPGVFRLARREDAQPATIARLLAEEFGGKGIAILDDRTAYGKGLADDVKDRLRATGVREALSLSYDGGQKEFGGLVSTLRSERIDAVFIGGYAPEVGALRSQMAEAGLDIPLLAGDAVLTEDYGAFAGAAAAGTLVAAAPDPRQAPEAQVTVAALEETGKSADGYVLPAYAAVQVYAEAVRTAESIDLAAVAGILQQGRFDTVLGPVGFDAKGDSTLPGFVWWVWADNRFVQR
ncbi:branched-chain amino acid ABC transporter substrate-binding protein [Polymorphum gilvum]|nr:branched-chain amino acid ABC transporter substrate-binding protein [Polymorphum gilvum]